MKPPDIVGKIIIAKDIVLSSDESARVALCLALKNARESANEKYWRTDAQASLVNKLANGDYEYEIYFDECNHCGN